MHAEVLPAEFRCGARPAGRKRKATAGGFGLERRRERELSTTADGNGIILLDWLQVLGWKVEIEHEDGQWVGLARHAEETGPELRVGGTATGLTGLAWELFIRAVERLEGGEEAVPGTLRAA